MIAIAWFGRRRAWRPIRSVSTAPPRVAQWADLATDMGRRYGVSPALILATIEQESGGNPHAISETGARGLMQLVCSTARWIGMTGACTTLYTPATNVAYGAKYLRYLFDEKQGDLELAVASYYAGPNSWKLTRIGGWFIAGDVREYVNGVIEKLERYG